LARIPGAGVAFSHHVVALRQDDDGVEVEAETPAGPRRFRGSYGRGTYIAQASVKYKSYRINNRGAHVFSVAAVTEFTTTPRIQIH
jgi:hypothetical protein